MTKYNILCMNSRRFENQLETSCEYVKVEEFVSSLFSKNTICFFDELDSGYQGILRRAVRLLQHQHQYLYSCSLELAPNHWLLHHFNQSLHSSTILSHNILLSATLDLQTQPNSSSSKCIILLPKTMLRIPSYLKVKNKIEWLYMNSYLKDKLLTSNIFSRKRLWHLLRG